MLWLIPNILTFGRLVLSVIFLGMVLYSPHVQNRAGFLDTAFVIFVIAGITDVIDGAVARKLNVASKFGRMSDPLVDKVLVCGTFICFALIGQPVFFGLSSTTMSVIRWAVAGIIVAREVYVTVLRHIAEARGINFAATVSGKVKMFLQSIAIGTVLIKTAHSLDALWADIVTQAIFAAMVVVTVVSGFRATRRQAWQKVRIKSG